MIDRTHGQSLVGAGGDWGMTGDRARLAYALACLLDRNHAPSAWRNALRIHVKCSGVFVHLCLVLVPAFKRTATGLEHSTPCLYSAPLYAMDLSLVSPPAYCRMSRRRKFSRPASRQLPTWSRPNLRTQGKRREN